MTCCPCIGLTVPAPRPCVASAGWAAMLRIDEGGGQRTIQHNPAAARQRGDAQRAGWGKLDVSLYGTNSGHRKLNCSRDADEAQVMGALETVA